MRIFKWVLASVALATLASCGGGSSCGNFATCTSTTTGGGGGTGTSAASQLSVVSSTATIPSDGSQTATITAYVRDANNALLPGVNVTFSSAANTGSGGGLSPGSATTNATGQASTTLITAGDTTLRTITVTATAAGLTKSVPVQVVAASGAEQLAMGSGTGASFTNGTIAISNTPLSAGGSTTLTVSIVNTADNSLYTGQVTVTFNSPCIASNEAVLSPSNGQVSTSTGIASVTYAASGCSGTDLIQATATVGTTPLSASGTVTVAQAATGSIVFVSAKPTAMGLQGTGSTALPGSSTVTFEVENSAGGPEANATVTFTLNSTVGGITLTPSSATSGSNGMVQTVVSAGTVATTVRVTATVASTTPAITTQSNLLTISTGIPTAGNFSLSQMCTNIEGWDYDGTTTTVSVHMADRFNNPVPDGTAVNFTSNGGNIQPNCTTTGGACTVTFTSQLAHPSNGRVALLATAIGEESFVDATGSGTLVTGDTWTDSSYQFRDDNDSENMDPSNGPFRGVSTYASPDFFYDFFNTGKYEGPDGIFEGVLCDIGSNPPCDPTPPAAGQEGGTSIGIGGQGLIILSGSAAGISDAGQYPNVVGLGPYTIGSGSSQGFQVWLQDLHGNAMPSGTTISLSVSGAGLGVSGASTYTVPCTTVRTGKLASGSTEFPFTISTTAATTGAGVAQLTVTTPKGNVTTTQIDVTVQ